MTLRETLLILLFGMAIDALGQFAPGPGHTGSTAIFKDSSIIRAWASECTLKRGWMNAADTSLGYATLGDAENAIGKAGDRPIVSLGDGGEAILTFDAPLYNGPGPDLAVFENGFAYALQEHFYFLELAFVEVSSDGINFFRFPAHCENDTTEQIDGRGIEPDAGIMDCRKVHNMAGKYPLFYGVPFDLDELKGTPGLDIMNITHVKIVDVVGSIHPELGTRDSRGRRVNDPFPTPFPSSGFDLDAVAAIHIRSTSAVKYQNELKPVFWPNPVKAGEAIHFSPEVQSPEIFGLNGEKLELSATESPGLPGFYLVKWQSKGSIVVAKLVVY